MSTSRTISPSLIKAYRHAHYFVHYKEEVLLLKVGFVNHALGNLLKAQGHSTAAFITAHNPYSQIASLEQNTQAHERLLHELSQDDIPVIEGLGTDPADHWEPEASVLALGISLVKAQQLADKFGQNAFIWIANAHGLVNLKLCYPIGEPSEQELTHWLEHLPTHLQEAASTMDPYERNWLMTANDAEQHHWLAPKDWDWNTPWPNTRPDGCPIALGTELDRMFKLTSNGLETFF